MQMELLSQICWICVLNKILTVILCERLTYIRATLFEECVHAIIFSSVIIIMIASRRTFKFRPSSDLPPSSVQAVPVVCMYSLPVVPVIVLCIDDAAGHDVLLV